MKLLKEIYDKDFLTGGKNRLNICYSLRKAARAVIMDKNNQVPLLFASRNNYHKLPGGGIKDNETVSEALRREILEEVGVTIKSVKDIGVIIEYRDEIKLLQISYCYFARINKLIKKPSFTKKELSEGFELKWMSFDKAIKAIKKDKPSNYTGRFIQKRDLLILSEVKGKFQH
jgi:8-oxo-dGTP diphosphatase